MGVKLRGSREQDIQHKKEVGGNLQYATSEESQEDCEVRFKAVQSIADQSLRIRILFLKRIK